MSAPGLQPLGPPSRAPSSVTRPASGFTLIEITVTMAILGVIVGVIYGVFAQTLIAKEHAEGRVEETRSAVAALTRITRDLRGLRAAAATARVVLVPTRPPGGTATPQPGALPAMPLIFLSHNRTEGGIPLDDLMFTAALRRPVASLVVPTDLATVRYFVDFLSEGSHTLGLFRETAYLLSGQTLDPEKADPGNSVLVLENVIGFELRFFDGRDWVQEWDSTDSRSYAPAPMAVEISLRVADDQGSAQTFQTSVDLPVQRPSQGSATPNPTPTP